MIDGKGLGERLKQGRLASGLSKKELAEKISVTPNYVTSIEGGRRVPKLETFVDLLCAMGVSADVVLLDSLPYAQQNTQAALIVQKLEGLTQEQSAYILKIMDVMIQEMATMSKHSD